MDKRLIAALAVTSALAGVPAMQAQAADFGNAYFLGDSLTGCCFNGRFTNGNAANWADQLPPLIGASYTATLSNNQAIGGAQSGRGNAVEQLFDPSMASKTGFLPQTERLIEQKRSFTSRDIVGVWIGTNDIWPSAWQSAYPANTPFKAITQPLGSRPSVTALTDYILGNVASGVKQLVALGLKNMVLASPYDMGVSEIYSNFGSVDAQTRPLATQYSEAFRNSVSRLYTPGVNMYFLDNVTLLRNVQANPGKYGFDHWTAADNCAASNCTALPLAQQNRFVFSDFIHTGSGFDQLMADYIANIINARDTLPGQGMVSQAVNKAFSDALFDRLDGQRPIGGSPATVGFSVFVDAGHIGIDRKHQSTDAGPDIAGFDGRGNGVTAGVQYRASSAFLVGAAFRYTHTTADTGGLGRGEIKADSYQGGLFASYSPGAFFVDGVVSFGGNRFDLRRPGVLDPLTASPNGSGVTVAARVGYLADLGAFKLGPVGELSYVRSRIDSYRESGDAVLAMGVNGQDVDNVAGSFGVQARASFAFNGGEIRPFANLMAAHDFRDGERTITSYQLSASGLPINTSGGRNGDNLYGKASLGGAVDFANGVSASLSGNGVVGRSYGNDYAVMAGLGYKF